MLTAGASAPQYVAQSTLSVGTATNVAGGAAGSLVYQTAAATTSTLALGTSGYILTAGASAPTYIQTLPSANGGTGFSTYATGDILYASAANTLSKLAAGTNGYVLTLSGGVPTWASSAAASGVTSFSAGTTGFTPNTATTGAVTLAGTLATTNGGTGLTSFTANGIPYASSTSALTTGSALTYNGTKLTVSGNINANNISVSSSTGFGGTDSGMYATAGKLNFASSGNTAITINSSAYVGVYTTTPTAKLHIVGSGNFQDTAAPTATNAFMLYSAPGTISGFPGGLSSFSQVNVNSFLRGTLDYGDGDTSVGITTAATVFIENAPATGTYTGITNPYALYVAAGKSYFGGAVNLSGGVAGTLTLSNTSENKLAITGNTSIYQFSSTTGVALSVGAGTYTSTFSTPYILSTGAASATSFGIPTFAAAASFTPTNGATVYIAGAPVASTNVTITNAYSLYIAAGASFFGGAVTLNSGGALSGTFTGAHTYSGAITLSGGGALSGTFTGAHTYSGAVTLSGGATVTGLTLAAGTATVAPLTLTSGTSLTSPVAGTVEYDGTSFFNTGNTTSGRGYFPSTQYFRLTADGSAITTIANFFGTSTVSLVTNAFYEIEAYLYFTTTGTGNATFTMTFTQAPVNNNAQYMGSPAGGIATAGSTQTAAIAKSTATAGALPATGSLTAGTHQYVFRSMFQANATTGGTLVLRMATAATNATPLTGSYFKITRLPAANTGTFT